jgi:hypothetical protein
MSKLSVSSNESTNASINNNASDKFAVARKYAGAKAFSKALDPILIQPIPAVVALNTSNSAQSGTKVSPGASKSPSTSQPRSKRSNSISAVDSTQLTRFSTTRRHSVHEIAGGTTDNFPLPSQSESRRGSVSAEWHKEADAQVIKHSFGQRRSISLPGKSLQELRAGASNKGEEKELGAGEEQEGFEWLPDVIKSASTHQAERAAHNTLKEKLHFAAAAKTYQRSYDNLLANNLPAVDDFPILVV